MTTSTEFTLQSTVDLTAPAPLARQADILNRFTASPAVLATVEAVTGEEDPRTRFRRLADLFRKADPEAAVEILKAAGKLCVREEASGLRLLCSFLEVKRPGLEVLHELVALSSLERVALRIGQGTWHEPDGSDHANTAMSIAEMLREAADIGAISLEGKEPPRDAVALRRTLQDLREWFRGVETRVSEGRKPDTHALHLVAAISMLEISLMEKRVSEIAGSIDPYDVRGMGRLMPVVSRYDQDIEHMKSVVSRLTTYEPFYERLISMEHAVSSSEMERIQRRLLVDPVAQPLGLIVRGMRENPILDREFIFLVSLVHQIWTLRSLTVENAGPRPDALSVFLEVVRHGRGGSGVRLTLEQDVADAIWPTVQTWGVLRRAPDAFEVRYREDRALDFIHPDGTPRFPERPDERQPAELSLKELVRVQINNEPFVLGILDNPKATQLPGLMAMIVNQSRSLRVLDRIMRERSLYTGPANKDVPRLMLMSPARISMNSLKRFIHVRFVSKVDLERLSRRGTEVREEVRREILAYLATLRK